MLQTQIFKYQQDDVLVDVRTVEIDGEIWFVAKDVAVLLGYTNPIKTISDHCREKGVTKRYPLQTVGGIQEVTLINEPNVYRLVSRSKLPSAERFEEWVYDEVLPSIRKKGFYGNINRTELPNFLIRLKDNYHKIPQNYFSVINELFSTLHAGLEKVGYQIPDKSEKGVQIMPDISVGMGFSKFLQIHGSELYAKHKFYMHSFPDGRDDVKARMYPNEALHFFRRYVYEKWIPENAEKYFRERDPLALDYLQKLLGGGSKEAA